MTTVNINRKVTDSYYRYKMPRIQAKVEGRGNGIKTVIANLCEVSKALNRPPLYPLKYMGCELGAQTIGDVKNDRYIVNGAHDSDKLQNILDTFIERYVLCDSCSNPETVLSVMAKKEIITMKCIACGHSTKVSTTHRASAYILKNPPTKNIKNKNSPKSSSKSTSKKNSAATTTTTNNESGMPILANNAPRTDNNNNDNELSMDGDGNDDCQWDADVSEAAVKQRQQMLSSHLRALTIDADTDRPIHEKLEILREFIQCKLSVDSNLDTHFDDIVNETKRLDIEYKAIFSISSVIFDNGIISQLKEHHNFLRRFCSDQQKIQKYLLASIERIVEQYLDQLIDKVPIIFKILFEADIIDEEVFLDWDSKRSSRFVSKETSVKIKAAAFKFIDWLKNAEEESSSCSDDEQVQQSPKASVISSNGHDDPVNIDSLASTRPSGHPVSTTSANKLNDSSNGVHHNSSDEAYKGNSMHDIPEKNKGNDDSDINIDDI